MVWLDFRRFVCVLAALMVASSWLAQSADAQFPPRRPQGLPERIDAAGTIEMLGRGVVLLGTPTGQKWQIQILPNAKVQVLGTATANVLQPGQFITFSAMVEKATATVQDKVSKLTIFTPSEHLMVGAFPVQGALGAGGLGAAEAGGRPAAARSRAAAANAGPPIEEFEIGAVIQSVKNGKLTLVARNPYFRPTFEIELADQPEISLDLAGRNYLNLIKPGDKIQSRGTQVGPNAAQVSEVTITLAQPLGAQQEPQTRQPRRTTRRSRRTPDEPPEGAKDAAPEPKQ